MSRDSVWVPRANQNAFSEHNSIQLDENIGGTTSSSLSQLASSLTLGDAMTHTTRDNIFRLLIRTAKSKVLIKTFPSPEKLDILLRIGIAKRMETDAWFHPFSLRSADARPELLIALIAAGCVCFGVPAISRTGLVLLEVVRVALADWVSMPHESTGLALLTGCSWKTTTVPCAICSTSRPP